MNNYQPSSIGKMNDDWSQFEALSLSTITGIGVVASLFMLNTIAIIYTMLGGMKAVVMTDVLQSIVMLGSMFALSTTFFISRNNLYTY